MCIYLLDGNVYIFTPRNESGWMWDMTIINRFTGDVITTRACSDCQRVEMIAGAHELLGVNPTRYL